MLKFSPIFFRMWVDMELRKELSPSQFVQCGAKALWDSTNGGLDNVANERDYFMTLADIHHVKSKLIEKNRVVMMKMLKACTGGLLVTCLMFCFMNLVLMSLIILFKYYAYKHLLGFGGCRSMGIATSSLWMTFLACTNTRSYGFRDNVPRSQCFLHPKLQLAQAKLSSNAYIIVTNHKNSII